MADVQVLAHTKFFLLSTLFQPVLEPIQSPIQWLPGLKQLEHEADHPPPTSATVKNMLIFTSTPTYIIGTFLNTFLALLRQFFPAPDRINKFMDILTMSVITVLSSRICSLIKKFTHMHCDVAS
jgi:hypothetical protein